MTIFLYIVIPSILTLLFLFYNKKDNNGSDHAIHVYIINRIKNQGNRVITDFIYGYNEKHVYYPQLYHLLLSFLPKDIYEKKFFYINILVKTIEILAFNIFLFTLYGQLKFEELIFLFANIVFNIFPFSYSVWNAKNTGLSARGVGVILIHFFTYLIIFYVDSFSYIILFFIIIITIITILTSMMSTQFIFLVTPFLAFFFGRFELILIPILSLSIIYAFSPKYTKNFLRGNYNFRRNYALYISKIFILKERHSVWRDLVYDIWLKIKNEPNKLKAIYYISKNPVIEIIYGMPFLWFVFYFFIINPDRFSNQIYLSMLTIIISAAVVFLLTTFRISRFLGEPQRYMEFTIPIITFLFVLTAEKTITIGLIILSIAIIGVYLFAYSRSNIIQKNGLKARELSMILNKEFQGDIIVASNDYQQLKFFQQYGFKVLMPDLTKYYKSNYDFQRYFIGDFSIISPCAIKDYILNYSPEILVLNTKLYTLDFLLKTVPTINSQYNLKFSLNEFKVYVKNT